MAIGSDIVGQAQTGTGKTAAFALPLLSRIGPHGKEPEILVLAPTRELAIQVAESFQGYARFLSGVNVLAIYGGQAYGHQLRQLRKGVQVVVGTPGRVMDHIRRGTLKLTGLHALVLDEADEMLRMGFIDDVEWILGHTPHDRQTALFSATMPEAIRQVARRHLRHPKEVRIDGQTATAKNIRQRYWQVNGLRKLEALTRILEVEDFDAMLIFVRTRSATLELAGSLAAKGYACEALNGDMPQSTREKTVEQFRRGKVDILVATDVAARGLDVERISHVLNYDIPQDTESYIHRIGRTGRAGRSGEAILFVAPNEKRLLKAIEQATRQPIERMQLPDTVDINQRRTDRFKGKISETLASPQRLEGYYRLVAEYQQEHGTDPLQIAAALALLAQGDEPLFLSEKEPGCMQDSSAPDPRSSNGKRYSRAGGISPKKPCPKIQMERFRLEVGSRHGVKTGNIVGAIANEADIESCYIGHVKIFNDFTTVYLPKGMPRETLQILKRTRIMGQRLDIKRMEREKGNSRRAVHKARAGGSVSGGKGRRGGTQSHFF